MEDDKLALEEARRALGVGTEGRRRDQGDAEGGGEETRRREVTIVSSILPRVEVRDVAQLSDGIERATRISEQLQLDANASH